jgi:hypothetical protein
MAFPNEEGPPSAKGDPRLASLLGGSDGLDPSQNPSIQQPEKRDHKAVLRAKSMLLREAIVEALSIAAHYSDTAITFAELGDDACLEMAMREFAKTASVATKAARELIALRRAANDREVAP